MTYLLDTTAVSDLMKEHKRVEENLANAGRVDRVVICTIVRGEILFGIAKLPPGKRRSNLEVKAEQILAAVYCEPVPQTAADQYARIKSDCQTKGIPLDENDLWIAATAIAIGATVVSRDSDYRAVQGLSVTDWTH
ncbi:MAG: type II toxin-antitoxin system VapC family toxin [Rhodopirellula sp.]|nr:type II toxin-antitoxin system VapC family toxin [Rhodopirellula sp.]